MFYCDSEYLMLPGASSAVSVADSATDRLSSLDLEWLAQYGPWRQVLYPSVQVTLPEGSTFLLPGQAVLPLAAQRLALPGMELAVHIREQVIPALQFFPEMLIDLTRELSWSDAFANAWLPCWHSMIRNTGPAAWPYAKLALSTSRKV